jgi:hypothetical protein
MAGSSKSSKGKLYLYYRCPGATPQSNTARECHAPSFRADHVDAVTWQWVKSNLIDPDELVEGLTSYQEDCERQNQPIRERLQLVDGLLSANRTQLQRLLDLYLSGEFPKEMLVDRKSRLEATVGALEKERLGLASSLEAHTLSDEQIESLQKLALKIAEGLQVAEERFEARRRIIELLDLQATLSIESGEKVVYARCILDEESLSVVSSTTDNTSHPTHSGTMQLCGPGHPSLQSSWSADRAGHPIPGFLALPSYRPDRETGPPD